MILQNNNSFCLNIFLRTTMLAILFLGALIKLNFSIENLIKFSIFIIFFTTLFQWQNKNIITHDNRLIKLLLLVQVFLCLVGYFYAELTSQIGGLIGFHIHDIHLTTWSREAFDPLKRSFSIFDNPNIAGRLLVLTFIAYSISVRKANHLIILSVILAIVSTGSRAALGVTFLFFIWGAIFQAQNRKTFLIWVFAISGLIAVFLIFTIALIDFRVFSVEKLIISAAYKINIFNTISDNVNQIAVYDTDISLIYDQFGILGTATLIFCFILATNLSAGPQLIALIYCFSGSLIFSTPTLALLFILYFSMKMQRNVSGSAGIFGKVVTSQNFSRLAS